MKMIQDKRAGKVNSTAVLSASISAALAVILFAYAFSDESSIQHQQPDLQRHHEAPLINIHWMTALALHHK